MKFFKRGFDGGPKSTVTGYWLTEIKKLFSVVLLKFAHGSRDEYHNHAFNSINWVLRGKVVEYNLDGSVNVYRPSLRPIITKRDTFHRVVSEGTTWVFSLRGPWKKTWQEYNPKTEQYTTLAKGRATVGTLHGLESYRKYIHGEITTEEYKNARTGYTIK